MRVICFSLLLLATFVSSGQNEINGKLTGTHWSPDSSLFVEVYKENLTLALPGQGSDHIAIIVLKTRSGEILQIVDSNSKNKILHRNFQGVKWEMDKNLLFYGNGRYIEWVDEDNLDMEAIRDKISIYLGYDSWQYYKIPEIFGDKYFVIGEFFGDPEYDYTLDLAILIKDSSDIIKLLIYEAYNFNYPHEGINIVDLKEDYSWVGNFKLVESGCPIWSNWVEGKGDDGWRTLEETPAKEITYLNHNALFLHAGESCGGGFIYWDNEQWNWKQQE